MTADQVDQWAHDPEQFLKDDDEESVSTTSARKVCLQLLDLMQSKFGAAYVPAITQAVFARLQQSAQMKAAGDAFWWRMREAAHLALGSAAVELTAQTIDLNSYLPILTEDAASSLPCLRATALWCSGQFPAELIDGRFAPFVQSAIETIQLANVQELPVRVFACRGLTSFLPKVPRASVAPLAAPLIQGLLGLLPSLSSEVASTVLDALIVALELSPETTAQLEPLVVGALLTLWQRHLADVMLTATIVDSFVTIASIKEAVIPLAVRAFSASIYEFSLTREFRITSFQFWLVTWRTRTPFPVLLKARCKLSLPWQIMPHLSWYQRCLAWYAKL